MSNWIPWRNSLRLAAVLTSTFATSASLPGQSLRHVEPDPRIGSSLAVIAENRPLVHTAQILPLDSSGEMAKGDAARQIEQVLENLESVLKAAGSGLEQSARINVYVTREETVPSVEKAFARRFNGPAKPAVSLVLTALPQHALVAMDAVAASREPVAAAGKSSFNSFLPGVDWRILPPNGAVYVSGQAQRGELPEATRQTLESLVATLAHLNLGREDIVHLKAFLRPMSEAAVVSRELERFFGEIPVPPVVYVEWISSGAPIEIELIAARRKDAATLTEPVTYFTPPGVKASPVFSRVAIVPPGRQIYTSSLRAKEAGDSEGQIREIFAELDRLLKLTGSDLKHLAKATYYVSENEVSRKLNELRPDYYDPARPPAASKAMVQGTGFPGKTISIDLIAVESTD